MDAEHDWMGTCRGDWGEGSALSMDTRLASSAIRPCRADLAHQGMRSWLPFRGYASLRVVSVSALLVCLTVCMYMSYVCVCCTELAVECTVQDQVSAFFDTGQVEGGDSERGMHHRHEAVESGG